MNLWKTVHHLYLQHFVVYCWLTDLLKKISYTTQHMHEGALCVSASTRAKGFLQKGKENIMRHLSGDSLACCEPVSHSYKCTPNGSSKHGQDFGFWKQ